MVKIKTKLKNLGFSTLEILIAFAILIFTLAATVSLVFGSQNLELDASFSRQAQSLAEGMLEQARVESAADWDSVSATSSTTSVFTENLQVADTGDYVKQVKADVSWENCGAIKSTELSGVLADTDELSGQGQCAQSQSGDWSRPQILGSVDLGATGQANAVAVKNGFAYVAADGDGTAYDFFIIDITKNPPQIVSPRIDTGPGLNSLQVSGNYAYLGNTSINSQLQVLDLTTFARKDFKLPKSSSGDVTNALFYYNHKIYLGLPKSAIAEFHVIDVSDINNIKEVGTAEFNTAVNAIYVSNGLAYVATPDDNEIQVMDVRDPPSVLPVAVFNAQNLNSGNAFARFGTTLYLGRTHDAITSHDGPELYALNLSNLNSNPVSAKIGATVSGLAASGNLIFAATSDAANQFQVWQLSGGGTSLSELSSLSLPAKATAIACLGERMYVTTTDPSHGLMVIGPGS